MEKFENIEKIIYFFTLNDVYGSSNIKGLKKFFQKAMKDLFSEKFSNIEIN